MDQNKPEKTPSVRVEPERAKKIRQRYNKGGVTMAQLAEEENLHRLTIGDIINMRGAYKG